MAAPDADEGRPEGLLPNAHFQSVEPLEVVDEAGPVVSCSALDSRRSSLQVQGGALSSRASSKMDDDPNGDVVSVASVRHSSRSIYGKRPQSVAQRRQSKLFVGMSLQQQPDELEEEEEQQAEEEPGKPKKTLFRRLLRKLKPRVIMPNERWYMVFWYFTMSFALANAIMDPFKLAFGPAGGFEPYTDFWSIIEYIGTISFLVDIILKFFIAYEDQENREMVTDLRRIAIHYLKLFFWLDLLFWFPFVGVINSSMPQFWAPEDTHQSDYLDVAENDSNTAFYVGLLGFLKMGRLYRIFHLFAQLEHAMIMSQMSLMLTRNFFYVLLTCHWFACLFWFMARAEGFSPTGSWVGRATSRFEGQNAGICYIYAFYLSVMSFTAVGDGELYANSPAESIVMSIYLLFNVVLGAYILGTVTMLMVKGDQRSAAFRDRITNLKDYSNINVLPKELHDAMRKHIELHFHSELSSDELVLAPYPMAIKKRVLRHLYLEPLRECYLFKTCKPKFLDAILAVCRTELFMPNVQLVTEGDIVSDLSVVIEGEVEVIPATSEGSSTTSSNLASMPPVNRGQKSRRSSFFMNPSEVASMSMKSGKSLTGSMTSRSKKCLGGKRGSSECFGEVAFFTETQSTDAVWTCQVTRVLVLPRTAYDELVKAYPNQARQVMTAVKAHVEQAMISEIMDVLDTIPPTSNSVHTRLVEYMDDRGTLMTTELPKPLINEIHVLFNTSQSRMYEQLDLIASSYKRFCARQDQRVVLDLLHFAQNSDEEELLNLLKHGVDPSCADFDQRSPLMIAAREGNDAIVRVLIKMGADVNAQDAFGNTALSEAVKKGRERAANFLVDAGATLRGCTAAIDDFFCARVVAGDEDSVEMLLEAGADANILSFDDRSLLHLAAAQGSLEIVSMLVNSGAAIHAVDRWGRTPLDDAVAAGHAEVVQFLEPHAKQREAGPRGLASLPVSNRSMNKRQTILSKGPTQRRRRTSMVTMQAPAHLSPAIPLALAAASISVDHDAGGEQAFGPESPPAHRASKSEQDGVLRPRSGRLRSATSSTPPLSPAIVAAVAPVPADAPSVTQPKAPPPVPALSHQGGLAGLPRDAASNSAFEFASPRAVASTTITPRDILVDEGLAAALDTANQVKDRCSPSPTASPRRSPVMQQHPGLPPGTSPRAAAPPSPVEQSPVEAVMLRQSELGNSNVLPPTRSLGKMMTVGPQASAPSVTRGVRGPFNGLSGPLMARTPTRDLDDVEDAAGPGGMSSDDDGRGGGLEEELAVAALARAAEKVAWGGVGGETGGRKHSSTAQKRH